MLEKLGRRQNGLIIHSPYLTSSFGSLEMFGYFSLRKSIICGCVGGGTLVEVADERFFLLGSFDWAVVGGDVVVVDGAGPTMSSNTS